MEDFVQTLGKTEFIKSDEITDIFTFLKKIDWTETWLIGLITFHIVLTTLTILTMNYHTVQGLLFFILLVSVRCSEMINEYAAKHWRVFSNQQYFDSGGLFISIIFSMPILFNCLMMVINWLWQSSNMMITVKRAELESRQNQSLLKDQDSLKKTN